MGCVTIIHRQLVTRRHFSHSFCWMIFWLIFGLCKVQKANSGPVMPSSALYRSYNKISWSAKTVQHFSKSTWSWSFCCWSAWWALLAPSQPMVNFLLIHKVYLIPCSAPLSTSVFSDIHMKARERERESWGTLNIWDKAILMKKSLT